MLRMMICTSSETDTDEDTNAEQIEEEEKYSYDRSCDEYYYTGVYVYIIHVCH